MPNIGFYEEDIESKSNMQHTLCYLAFVKHMRSEKLCLIKCCYDNHNWIPQELKGWFRQIYLIVSERQTTTTITDTHMFFIASITTTCIQHITKLYVFVYVNGCLGVGVGMGRCFFAAIYNTCNIVGCSHSISLKSSLQWW